MRYRFEAFDESHAETILSWVESPTDREAWASRADLELSPTLVRAWHSDPDVQPHVLFEDGEFRAHGKVWADEAEAEAEPARVVVAPARRGRAVGRGLVRLLAQRALALGFDAIWVRVLPTNRAALACYRAAGFVQAAPAEEAAFNVGQPRQYLWMRLAAPTALRQGARPPSRERRRCTL